MLFRSRRMTTPNVNRFGALTDGFAFRIEGDLHVAEIASGPERSVEQFCSLADHMPPVVDFAMWCVRSNRRFAGEGLALAEVSDVVARLKVALVASGGVEVAVFTGEEQVALSPLLDLWIYAKSDRWYYLLLGLGLEERSELRRRTWTMTRSDFTGAPELVEAVSAAAERLTLKRS